MKETLLVIFLISLFSFASAQTFEEKVAAKVCECLTKANQLQDPLKSDCYGRPILEVAISENRISEVTTVEGIQNIARKTDVILQKTCKGYKAPTPVTPVSSIADLQKAIDKAVAGDVIVVANGVYTTDADITIDKQGKSSQPITIMAQSIGGVEIKGNGGFNITGSSSYITIQGFKFTHAASKAKTGSNTSFCKWTRNVFETPGTGEYLTIAGNDHEVEYNTFQNKDSLGRFIAIRGKERQIAERLWIHHNYFKTQKNQGNRNGAEALQFGLSGFSLSSSNSVVEYNLFEDCAGENELISVKASAVVLRYNTIRNCPAQFTLRHGNFCQVYGNYFINTPGLRIFGDDHVIHSNYFEDCSIAINIGNGGAEVADGAPLTSHDRPDRVLIAFNTMVNNKANYLQTQRQNGLGATNVIFVNNLIQGGGPAATISGPYTNATWKGNIIFNTNGAGDLPADGYTMVDPKLEKDASGTYHLQAGSPVIDMIKDAFASIIVDMDGQPRTAPLDVGADENSKANIIARILTTSSVGHAVANSQKLIDPRLR